MGRHFVELWYYLEYVWFDFCLFGVWKHLGNTCACMSELLLLSISFTGISAGWYYTWHAITTACLHRRRVQKSQVVELFSLAGKNFLNGFYVLLWIKCGHLEIPAYWFNFPFSTTWQLFWNWRSKHRQWCLHAHTELAPRVERTHLCLSSSTRFFSALSCFTF